MTYGKCWDKEVLFYVISLLDKVKFVSDELKILWNVNSKISIRNFSNESLYNKYSTKIYFKRVIEFCMNYQWKKKNLSTLSFYFSQNDLSWSEATRIDF